MRCRGHLVLCTWERSGAQALPGLLHVATEGLGRCGAVLDVVMVSETRPGVLFAGFDVG